MIELNSKTQQDFLNREWVQKLLDAGVDMSDAKYCIYFNMADGKDYISLSEKIYGSNYLPTYTVSELLYKLHEWIYPTIDGKEYSGGLHFIKDAPFYIFYYDLAVKGYRTNDNFKAEEGEEVLTDDYIYAEFEYPIESLASLLLQCHKKDIGIARKDTGDIRDK